MQPPNHSREAIARFPAPDRAHYFNGADYAMACMRTYNKRIKFDGPPPKTKIKKPEQNQAA
jgi:hypothetical protein